MKKVLAIGLLICLTGCAGLRNNALMVLQAAEMLDPSTRSVFPGYGSQRARSISRAAGIIGGVAPIAASILDAQPRVPSMQHPRTGMVVSERSTVDRKKTVNKPVQLASNNRY